MLLIKMSKTQSFSNPLDLKERNTKGKNVIFHRREAAIQR